tara:strand:+ start:210 stop:491 length:282 start_codon:yes stop_codon:yes gene_type:complete
MKAMADLGTTEYKYRRNYIAVNPDPALGPLTWRTASPQEIGSINGGGGGTGERYEFEGQAPVDIETTPNGGTDGRTLVDTSIDISQLDDRATN